MCSRFSRLAVFIVMIPSLISLAACARTSEETMPEPPTTPPTGTVEPVPQLTLAPTAAPSGPVVLETGVLPDGMLATREGLGLVTGAALSPDGQQLAVGSPAGLGVYWTDTFEKVWFVSSRWPVGEVAWSLDGSLITTRAGCMGCAIGLWDAQSGEFIRGLRLDVPAGVTLTAAPAPDGAFVAAILTAENPAASRVTLFDAVTGEVLADQPGAGVAWSAGGLLAIYGPAGVLAGQPGGDIRQIEPQAVDGAVWSPDGARIALRLADHSTIRVLIAAAGAEVAVLTGGGLEGTLEWSVDGAQIAVIDTASIAIWDAVTGELLSTVTASIGELDATATTAWSPNLQRLAAAQLGEEHVLQVWDAASGESAAIPVPGYIGRHIRRLWWSLDGVALLAGVEADAEGGLVIYAVDPATGTLLRDLEGYAPPVYSIAWSPDGMRIVYPWADGAVVVDVATGRQVYALAGHADWGLSAAWSPDGAQIATGGQDGTILLWNPADGTTAGALTSVNAPVYALVWSPDGTRLAAVTTPPGALVVGESLGQVVMLDAATGEVLFALEGLSAPLAWSPDSTWLLAGVREPGGITRIDGRTGETIPLTGRTEWATNTYQPRWTGALAPDGSRYIHAFIEPGTLGTNNFEILDLASGAVLKSTEAQYATVGAWGWSPDGLWLAMFAPDGLHIWDAETGRTAMQWTAALGDGTALAWAPDSARIFAASSHGALVIWDAGGE